MEKSKQKQKKKDWQILIEESGQNELTKEIAQALIEVSKMKTGTLQPLSLKDIWIQFAGWCPEVLNVVARKS